MTVRDGDDPALPGRRVNTHLRWGDNRRGGGAHIEWHAPCGCAYHPLPFPHVHPCCDEHKRPDLHGVKSNAEIQRQRREAAMSAGISCCAAPTGDTKMQEMKNEVLEDTIAQALTGDFCVVPESARKMARKLLERPRPYREKIAAALLRATPGPMGESVTDDGERS